MNSSMIPDLINPLDLLIGRLRHGPMVKIMLERGCGFTGYQAEQILRRYHVRVWGRVCDHSEEVGFYVKASQAKWATYLLWRAGVPLVSCALPSNGPPRRAMPRAWQREGVQAHTLADLAVDWLGRLFT